MVTMTSESGARSDSLHDDTTGRSEHWKVFSQCIQDYYEGLFCGQERLFLAMVCFDAGLCMRSHWGGSQMRLQAVPFEDLPSAFDIHFFIINFLGAFIIDPDEFEHLRFLNDSGVVDQSDSDSCVSEDSCIGDTPEEWAGEEDESITQKYTSLTFSAAGKAACGLLHLLERCKVYSLPSATAAATSAVQQLPACMMLLAYLPGPLNLLKHLMLSSSETSGPRIDENALQRFMTFRSLVPLFQVRHEVAKLESLQVVETHNYCLFVTKVQPDGRFVELSTHYGDKPAATTIQVEFDAEVAMLMLPGMRLAGVFDKLSDDSWCYHSPCPVQPPFVAHVENLHGRCYHNFPVDSDSGSELTEEESFGGDEGSCSESDDSDYDQPGSTRFDFEALIADSGQPATENTAQPAPTMEAGASPTEAASLHVFLTSDPSWSQPRSRNEFAELSRAIPAWFPPTGRQDDDS